jgi:hypothetical protein
MLIVATIIIMLVTAYAHYRNGLFTSIYYFMAVLVSGLVAFSFWEPLSDLVDQGLQRNMKAVQGCEDFVVLCVLFGASLFLLRLGYQKLAPDMIDEHGALQHLGAAVVGLATGYFVAGFLTCATQTLPLDEHFLDFETRAVNESGVRSLVPPDRVWLALMRNASQTPLGWKEDKFEGGPVVFDREGTFELRYQRYRRTTETRPAMVYSGEFDRELGKEKKK